ncbi:thiamine phosphate synthase [Aquimarina agarilytica]|uniref:thiamine phosphate synthase n=1 Tax=Aquimarina agarilytica TaxID=1087449 RepID=UPI0002888687|nr:thiamine phosphate synthase [Aquimarina agarilytica]
MLLLITPENDIPNEIELLNSFFEAGLEILHLRKPHKNYAQHMAYLSAIDETYHNRIVLHYQHDLAEDFMLKGIHIQEQPRIDLGEDFGLYVARFTSQGYDVSTSFHNPSEIMLYAQIPLIYNLLSPVFTAISQPNMEGKAFDVNPIKVPVIGMGGVHAKNIGTVKKLGYVGVGVLGGVWNAKNPLVAFKELELNTKQEFKN